MHTQPEPEVGLRLRALRNRLGLSLRALSERSGLSINAISQIERAENSPTVSTLHRLATALDISITDFFQEEDRQTVVYVKRDRGLRSRSNGVTIESLGIGLSDQKLEPFRIHIAPGVTNNQDPISHPGEEFTHCLEGEIEYIVGDRDYLLQPGDSLLFDATQMHAYHNRSDKPATLLVVFQSTQDRQLIRQLHLEAESNHR